jgi:hypothetical protein
MSGLTSAGRAILQLMEAAQRGPKREGLFALWLTVRVIEDLGQQPPPPDRAHRRRVTALEHRLSSLALPSPLRRGIAGTLHSLKDAERSDVSTLLSQLAAPTREAVGVDAADVLTRAAREQRQRR